MVVFSCLNREGNQKADQEATTTLGPVIVMILDLLQDMHVVLDPQKFIQSAFEIDFRFTDSIQ